MTELISVIVPVYKVSVYLDKCITSIVNQTYKNLEIILVDDGSPDECPIICDNWAAEDSRIKVIHKANGGISDARNVGMDAATGEMFVFVDGDDYIEPEYVEYLYCACKETGAEISQCKHHKFTDDIEELSYVPEKKKKTTVYSCEEVLRQFGNAAEKHNHFVWDKLYCRSILNNERFEIGFQSQDVLFNCHVFCNCNSIAVIDSELYHYRMRLGSASNVFLKQRIDAFEMYYRSYDYLRVQYPQFAVNVKARCCSLCIGAADWALHVADKEDGQKIMEETYRYRKKIQFTFKEWMLCSLSDKIRIIFSDERILIPAMRVRYLVRIITGK